MSSLAEMDSIYGLEDTWDMLEILSIDNHNQRLWSKFYECR